LDDTRVYRKCAFKLTAHYWHECPMSTLLQITSVKLRR